MVGGGHEGCLALTILVKVSCDFMTIWGQDFYPIAGGLKLRPYHFLYHLLTPPFNPTTVTVFFYQKRFVDSFCGFVTEFGLEFYLLSGLKLPPYQSPS